MKTEVDELDTYEVLGCLETVSKEAARQIETELRTRISVLEDELRTIREDGWIKASFSE